MSFTFRPAVLENTAVLVGIAGPSGGGKTYSALRLARGLVGPTGKIAFIDTEARRALHYAKKFQFDHAELQPPFTPERYREAVEAAEKHVGPAGAIVIDSATHEWAGDGGCQDIHDASIEKMLGDEEDPRRRAAKAERLSALGWRDAKLKHKRMMSRLLQCRAHIIFCLRAEEKIKFEKVKEERNGREYEKTVIVPIGWQPICEKNFMFEMTVSFMLSDLAKHLPTAIKLQDQHAAFFPLDKPIDEAAGVKLAAWAKGGVAKPPSPAAKVNGGAMPADETFGLPPAPPDDMPEDRGELGPSEPELIEPEDAAKARAVAEADRDHVFKRLDSFTAVGAVNKYMTQHKATIDAMPRDIVDAIYDKATDRLEALSGAAK